MFYFTVGPTQLYPRFREFLDEALTHDIASISHRSPQFVELFNTTRDALISLLRAPADRQVFYAGSATEWMERCVQNMSSARTLHFVSGTFSKRFYDFALSQGMDARKVDQKPDGSFVITDVPAGFSPELIAITHNETSNGTQMSPAFFETVRAAFPDALIAVDIVSSAPVHPDAFMQADAVFFSVQKGFGMPAGLGVCLVSPRAVARSAELLAAGQYTGAFHSFSRLAEYAAKGNTVETPNVLGMHLLRAIVRDLIARGVDVLRAETKEKAALIRSALADCAETELEPIAEAYRSETVIVAKTPGGSKLLIDRLKAEGMTIASGYGAAKDTHIRIGNFAAQTPAEMTHLAALLRA